MCQGVSDRASYAVHSNMKGGVNTMTLAAFKEIVDTLYYYATAGAYPKEWIAFRRRSRTASSTATQQPCTMSLQNATWTNCRRISKQRFLKAITKACRKSCKKSKSLINSGCVMYVDNGDSTGVQYVLGLSVIKLCMPSSNGRHFVDIPYCR